MPCVCVLAGPEEGHDGKQEVLMYSTVTLCLHRGQWGSSHFFFPFKNDSGSSVCCMQVGRRVCVCCQVRSVPCSVSVCVSACARAHVLGNGGRAVGFYLFQMCCAPDEPPEGF